MFNHLFIIILTFTSLIVAQICHNTTLMGRWACGPCCAVYSQGDTTLFGHGAYLKIVDFTNLEEPKELSKLLLPTGSVYDIVVYENHGFIAAGYEGMLIINLTDIKNPVEVSTYPTKWFLGDVTVSDNFAYLPGWQNGLQIIDISDPTNPVKVGYYDPEGWVTNIEVNGIYAYVTLGYDGLIILDISDKTNPVEVGRCYLQDCPPCWAIEVKISGTYAYVGAGYLRIIDINNPQNPLEVSSCSTSDQICDIEIRNHYAYIGARNGLRIVDIGNPLIPEVIGYCNTEGWAYKLSVGDTFAYLADPYKHLHIFSIYDPLNIYKAGYYEIEGSSTSIAVKDNYAYVTNTRRGLIILNISDLENPIKVASDSAAYHASNIELVDNYAYITSGFEGLRILDISNPENPIQIGMFKSHSNYCIDVKIIGDYAYLVEDFFANCPYFLHVIDISNPRNPVEVERLNVDGNGIAISGNYAFLSQGDGNLQILNITDPYHPFIVSSFGSSASNVIISGKYLFALSNGLKTYDISDPENPVEVGYYQLDKQFSGIAIDSIYVYMTCHEYGLRIINILNLQQPFEVGYYDTYDISLNITASDGTIYLADRDDGVYFIRNNLYPTVDSSPFLSMSLKYQLKQNFPNPFNSNTTITYKIKESGDIKIVLFDISGQELEVLLFEHQPPGEYYFQYDAKDKSSGIYFYHLIVNDNPVATKKMVLIK